MKSEWALRSEAFGALRAAKLEDQLDKRLSCNINPARIVTKSERAALLKKLWQPSELDLELFSLARSLAT